MPDSILLSAVDVAMYIQPWKLIPPVVVLLLFARLATWADKDSQTAHLPRVPVNLGVMGVGALGFLLFFIVPNFVLGTVALVVLNLVAAGGYIGLRASQIGTKDLSKQFRDWLDSFKKEGRVKEITSEVQVVDSKGRLIAAPEDGDLMRAGYDAVQELLVEPLKKNAETIQLAPSGEQYKLTFVVDGVPYAGPTPERNVAQAAIDFIKTHSGLDLDEKRKPQKGKLKAATGGKRKELEVSTAGSSAGEAVQILVDPKERHKLRLEQLGMSDLQEDAIRSSIGVKEGIVLLAAPKGHGLTSLCYAVIRAHDAFLTHIHTIERGADQDLEGITQNRLAVGTSPAEELKQVTWVCSQEPEVIMLTSLEEPASAKELVKFAATGRKAYVAVRADSALEAVNVWRKWVGDDNRAMRHLIMAVSGRVVRKLCVQCKVSISPDPEQLRKMNLDPQKVTQLFQERTEPMVDQKGNPMVCDICQDLRFKGRRGVYEVVIIDDEVREAVVAGAGLSQLRTIIRKQRIPFLQESALEVIQKGDTSVKEVQRVFAAKATPAKATAG
jgi:type II secretory ATPase GspE/PulE/Tfp pilus assembly ATPase PilB-like protein